MNPLLLRAILTVTSALNRRRSGRSPPRQMPDHLRAAYTEDGAVPVVDWFVNDIKEGPIRWSPRSLFWSPRRVARRGHSYYGKTDAAVYAALDAHPVRGSSVVILGSETPWYECVATHYGAKTTTIEYRTIDCTIPGLETMTPDTFAANPRTFDAALSISSIEHDGLGRYGDPLNPNGDLDAMKRMRALLRPGGLLYLSVPVGPDAVVWNAHRVYGRRRLPRLLSGWRTVASFDYDETMLDRGPLGGFENQPVFVLTAEPD